MKLKITEEQRSMIAGYYLATHATGNASICCGDISVCVAIVGPRFAAGLRVWAHENLSCGALSLDEDDENGRLAAISVLDELIE